MPGTPDPWGNGGRHRLRASGGPLFGVDVHPTFQAGFSVDEAAAQGIGFMACKVSEGTWTYDSRAWLSRAQAIGQPAAGYHYLHPGSEDQQAQVFAAQLAAAGDAPGILDAEALTTGALMTSGDGQGADSGGMGHHPHPGGGLIRTSEVRHARGAIPAATLTVTGIRAFLAAAAKYGADVRALYLPFWYWQRMGSPDLSPLALPLWASSYPSGNRGTPAQLYPAVDPGRWAAYGGLPTAVLQFSQTGIAGGIQPVDLDAFLGTQDQMATLLGIPSPLDASVRSRRRQEDNDMQLPATQDRIDQQIPTDVVGGWCGAANLLLTANTGGATVYGVYAITDRGATPPLVMDLLAEAAGHDFVQWWPMKRALPAGTTSVVVNYTAPGGMVARIEYER